MRIPYFLFLMFMAFCLNISLVSGEEVSVKPNQNSALKIKLKSPPVYPVEALVNGIEGVVLVEYVVYPDGSVKDVFIRESNPLFVFDDAALNAVSKWQFIPKITNGKPVKSRLRSEIKFKLQKH